MVLTDQMASHLILYGNKPLRPGLRLGTVPAAIRAGSAAWRTLFTRASNVNGERPSLKLLVVEHLDGLEGFFVRGELDEGKAA